MNPKLILWPVLLLLWGIHGPTASAQAPANPYGNYWYESAMDGRLLQLVIKPNGTQFIDAQLDHLSGFEGSADAPMAYELKVDVPYTPKNRRIELVATHEEGPDRITAIFHKANELLIVLEYGPYAETLIMTRHE